MHLIARAKDNYKLSDILRDFKKHTSKQIIKLIQEEPESRKEWLLQVMAEHGKNNDKNKTYQLWRNDNHPIELHSNEVIKQKLDYILPLRCICNVAALIFKKTRSRHRLLVKTQN